MSIFATHMLKHIMKECGIEIPAAHTYEVAVDSIAAALGNSELANRASWKDEEMRVEVGNVLRQLYTSYLLSLSKNLSAPPKHYRFQNEMEHAILIHFLKNGQWGSKVGVFAYLINQMPAISAVSGIDEDTCRDHLKTLFNEIFSDVPRWWRSCLKAAAIVGSIILTVKELMSAPAPMYPIPGTIN